MHWIVISSCVVALWSMLSVFGGERRRQINELEARKHAEAVLAAEQPKN